MSTDRSDRGSTIGNFYKSLFLTNRFFLALALLVLIAILCFIFSHLFFLLQLATLLFIILLIIDCVALYRVKDGIRALRTVPDRLSNGDENPIAITVTSSYGFSLHATIVEEVPFQFQVRNMIFNTELNPDAAETFNYSLKPTKRGAYQFGRINVFVSSKLFLIQRRYIEAKEQTAAVYPAFLEVNKFDLMAISNQLANIGAKRIRRIGNATEFEHIKSYVIGDDPRTINYKATARTNDLMVNTYTEERSQTVYCLIDKGRTMQMPFNQLTLLDYAINSSLLLSTTALRKGDKAGLITFSSTIDDILPASERRIQRSRLMETLYRQETDFKDADYSNLFITVKRCVKQRSLLVLFTNFETLSALRRQLPYLKLLAKDHLLIVAFFLNTEIDKVLDTRVDNEEDYFRKSVAEKMHSDKILIVKELNRHGIQTILTAPENLSVLSINKYLEIKTRSLI